jgi:AcrR family transcriptional regulator
MIITVDMNIFLALTAIAMNTRRGYTMTARARAVEATRTSILGALVELAMERVFTEISLDVVAGRAGVSVQTVLRHFGSRDGLIDAGMLHAEQTVVEERRTPHGEVSQAVRVIVDHYEQRGRSVLLLLAQEPTDPRVARITDNGRRLHRAWVEEVFAPLLPTKESEQATGVDLLVVATDVYTWKLLRLDRGLTRAQSQQRIERLVRAVLTELGGTGRTHS